MDYFPDNFDRLLSCIPEDGLKEQKRDVREWDSDYRELMECTKNSNYGRFKCFHCLLSPDGDDPIFIGINRLVPKGLKNGEQEKDLIQYPCNVVNRFECPYERSRITKDHDIGPTDSHLDVEDLFRLQKMAFIVEIAFAKARKDDSEIRIKDKQDLLNALTDRDTFAKTLRQTEEAFKITEYLKEITDRHDIDNMIDYFIRIKEKINLDELRLY